MNSGLKVKEVLIVASADWMHKQDITLGEYHQCLNLLNQ